MNPVIRVLIGADFFLMSGLGLIGPVFAIFVERHLVGGSIAAAGVAQTVYMVVKSLLQIVIGRFNDGDRAYIREYWTMVAGYFLLATVPILYTLIQTVNHLYAVQVVFGIGAGLSYPGFMTLFTKFTDAHREGSEWSTYSTVVFLGMALTATIGAWAVERWGFTTVFYGVAGLGGVGFLACASLGLRYADLQRDHHPPRRHHRDVPPIR